MGYEEYFGCIKEYVVEIFFFFYISEFSKVHHVALTVIIAQSVQIEPIFGLSLLLLH